MIISNREKFCLFAFIVIFLVETTIKLCQDNQCFNLGFQRLVNFSAEKENEERRKPHPVNVSPEILSNISPFYGMLHKNEYGLPLKTHAQVVQENHEKSQNEWESWKYYFPQLLKNFQILEEFNPKLLNKSLATYSASVTMSQSSYQFGETFLATIKSLDWKQRIKPFGGDYYRVRLMRQNNSRPADGIPYHVVDNNDGTYTATAPLWLEGKLLLEIKLVNSVEGIKEIVIKTENLVSWGHEFEATLENSEVVNCNLQRRNSNRQVM